MKKRCIILNVVSSEEQAKDDKISLETQERKGREAAEKHGWEIIDILNVPGQSRYRVKDYTDLETIARKKGIDAYTKLRLYWERRDFDILIVYRANRIARKQSLFAYIAENIFDAGAAIYEAEKSQFLDVARAGLWTAIEGYIAAQQITDLKADRKDGIANRASLGLPVSSKDLSTYKILRDENGKAIKRIPDASLSRLYLDLGDLILEGVSYRMLEDRLAERDHFTENGEKYPSLYWYAKFMNPVWWGHTAQYHNSSSNSENSENGYRKLLCIFDAEKYPQPKGVKIYWNTHEAIWKGEVGEQIKREILRRSDSIGRSTPGQRHRFRRLCVCASCGKPLSTHPNGNYRGLRCRTAHDKKAVSKCHNKRIINEKKIINFVDSCIRKILSQDAKELLINIDDTHELLSARLITSEREIQTLERKLLSLIDEQSYVSGNVAATYREKIEQISLKLEKSKLVHAKVTAQLDDFQGTLQIQEEEFENIVNRSLDLFWQQEGLAINQILERLFGKKRIVILNGEIIGVSEINANNQEAF